MTKEFSAVLLFIAETNCKEVPHTELSFHLSLSFGTDIETAWWITAAAVEPRAVAAHHHHQAPAVDSRPIRHGHSVYGKLSRAGAVRAWLKGTAVIRAAQTSSSLKAFTSTEGDRVSCREVGRDT